MEEDNEQVLTQAQADELAKWIVDHMGGQPDLMLRVEYDCGGGYKQIEKHEQNKPLVALIGAGKVFMRVCGANDYDDDDNPPKYEYIGSSEAVVIVVEEDSDES